MAVGVLLALVAFQDCVADFNSTLLGRRPEIEHAFSQPWQVAKVKPVDRQPSVGAAIKGDALTRDANPGATNMTLHLHMNEGTVFNVLQKSLLSLAKRGHRLVVNDDIQACESAVGAGVATDAKLCHFWCGVGVGLCGLMCSPQQRRALEPHENLASPVGFDVPWSLSPSSRCGRWQVVLADWSTVG